jgi:ABC-2 type transport system permease protein
VSPASRYAAALLFFMAALIVLLLLMLVVGAAVFRIALRNPAAIMALSIGFALFAAGLHLTITAMAKNDRSASLVGSVIIMVLSLVGGAFVPAETYPPFLQSLAFVMPNGAAQQGFVEVLAHQYAFSGVLQRIAITWAWAIGLTAVALVLVRRRSDS